MPVSWVRMGLCLVALVLASCADGPTAPEAGVATTLTLGAPAVTLSALGESRLVGATVRDQTGQAMAAPVSWSARDMSVAIVSDGLVIAVGEGQAYVTATSGAASDSVLVIVAQVAETLELRPDSIVLADPGDTFAVLLSAEDSLGSTISTPSVVWTSSDEGVATVDANGVVTAVATGAAAIMADVDGATGAVGVRVAPELTLVAAGPDSVDAVVAKRVSLSVRVEDLLGTEYAGATVTWGTVAGGGQIVSTATSESDATGHAAAVWQLGTGAGLQRASASLLTRGNTVSVEFVALGLPDAPVNASLVSDSVLLSAIGETAFLAPTYADVYGNTTTGEGVLFTSRDSGVVMTSADGLITGQGAGSTYVTTSFGGPVTDSILVTLVERGAITITFDDGWLTTFTEAFPVFQEFDLPANVGVNPGVLTFPAYMDLTQLNELHDAGWSMVNHTMNHPNITTLSDIELDYEIRAAKEFLDAQGFRGTDVFIVPYHDWGVRERNAVAQYHRVARGAAASLFTPDSLVQWMPPNPYDLTGYEMDTFPYTTPQGRDDLRAILQRTVDEGVFIDLFFHQVPTANVAALRETLTVINDFRDRVLPYHELYPQFARTVF